MSILYPPETCACFTGHRAISRDDMRTAAEKTAEQVRLLYNKGIFNYYAGGALGYDLAASVTLLNLKNTMPRLTLNLALPCPGYMKKWSEGEIALFERVKSRADSCVYVSDEYHRGCMHKRNRYMVDRSSVCIAYMTEESGGTVSTVSYALKKGLKVINVAGDLPYGQIGFDI